MVTFLVARVPGSSGIATELLSGPAFALVRHQLDALVTGAEGVAAAVRTGAAHLDPGVAGALAGLAAVVVAAFTVAAVVGIAGIGGAAGPVGREAAPARPAASRPAAA